MAGLSGVRLLWRLRTELLTDARWVSHKCCEKNAVCSIDSFPQKDWIIILNPTVECVWLMAGSQAASPRLSQTNKATQLGHRGAASAYLVRGGWRRWRPIKNTNCPTNDVNPTAFLPSSPDTCMELSVALKQCPHIPGDSSGRRSPLVLKDLCGVMKKSMIA